MVEGFSFLVLLLCLQEGLELLLESEREGLGGRVGVVVDQRVVDVGQVAEQGVLSL